MVWSLGQLCNRLEREGRTGLAWVVEEWNSQCGGSGVGRGEEAESDGASPTPISCW